MDDVKYVFLSVYLNSHQVFLSNALYRLLNKQFYFIETLSEKERRGRLGDGVFQVPYVLHRYLKQEAQQCKLAVLEADVILSGGIQNCGFHPKLHQLVFRYSERPLKNRNSLLKFPVRFLRWHFHNPPGKPIYMLCASAFAAGDYAKFGLFKKRCYKWGYFPETRRYADIDKLLSNKSPRMILWCGRFLDWKHPDDAITLARRFRESGIPFELNLIGAGPLESKLDQQVQVCGLQNCVKFLGAMPPQQVRDHMERAGIFIFTSDRNEGWGAVLNEAMNSGCAVVASDAIGAVPYLVKDRENGMVYHSGWIEELYEKVKYLIEHPERQRTFGKAAYHTIADLWNAETAAARLIRLAQAVLDGDLSPDLYESGPCSRAEVIEEDWYQG